MNSFSRFSLSQTRLALFLCFQKAECLAEDVGIWGNFRIAYIGADWLCPESAVTGSTELLYYCANEYKITGLAGQRPDGSPYKLFGFEIVT